MGPSKKQKAEALDIKIISEDDFVKIIYAQPNQQNSQKDHFNLA